MIIVIQMFLHLYNYYQTMSYFFRKIKIHFKKKNFSAHFLQWAEKFFFRPQNGF